jgi:radical SAM protein with 4Fe4S-binding SPASM domain
MNRTVASHVAGQGARRAAGGEALPVIDAAEREGLLRELLATLRTSRGPIDTTGPCDSGDFIRFLNYQVLTNDIPHLDAPTWLNWDITERCNCRCVHCSSSAAYDADGTGSDPMGTAAAHRIIEELARLEVLNVVLSGGEPFMRPDFYELLEHIKETGIFVTILTNGSLALDYDRLGALIDPSTDLIQVSLDGATAPSHNAQRRAEVFHRTVRAIERLLEARLPLKLNMVITPLSMDQALPVYRLARRLGVPTISFTANVPVGRGEGLPGYDHARFLDLSLALVRERAAGGGPAIRNNLVLIPYAIPEIRALVPPSDWTPFPRLRCLAGTSKAVLSAAGDLYPCPFLLYPAFNAGNVLAGSLEEVWSAGRGWEGLRGGRSFAGTKCASCAYVNLCRGECPGAAYGVHGTIDAPDGRCTWEP